MIPAITEVNFPSYATLSQATVSLQEMGERTITTQVKIDGSVVPDFGGWELRFKGERFILPVKEPQAAKDNTSRRSVVDLTFQSWAVYQLKRYFFVSLSQIQTGVAIPDQYNASINLSLESFVQLFNNVLKYYFGSDVRMDLFGAGTGIYSTEPVLIEINKTYIWDVLVKFYEVFNVRWWIEYDSQTSAYVIKVGYTAPAITDHDFEYGYKGGLLRFERQVQDASINNILLGRGGEKNLPYRYFKLQDPNNTAWAADPDAIPELANVYFDRLRDINYRWYVRGWMQNPNRDTSWDSTHTFPSYTENDCPEEFLFAFRLGKTDAKFNPIEYVKSVESIAKYGERWGAVDDNDDVFPTIQNVTRTGLGRVDEVVSVSPMTSDDIEAASSGAAQYNTISGTKTVTNLFRAQNQYTQTLRTDVFSIPSGKVGNLEYTIMNPRNGKTGAYYPANTIVLDTTALNIKAVNVSTGDEVSPYGLTEGTYYLKYTLYAENVTQEDQWYATYGFNSLTMAVSDASTDAWKPTFDIWVKNIWETTQGSGESDAEYAARVWQPILGDRAGNEAKIVFSDGFMSISQDYEFTIASYPVKDRSKTITSGGVTYTSEWKITLYKNDAEFQATGLYIPNSTTGGAPVSGDHFFFIGIDMPHQYVEWAEETLNGSTHTPVVNKAAALDGLAEINPTWLISLDKVRCNTHEGAEYGQHLADRLAAGATVRIKDKRFTNGNVLTLYVQSISYTWNEPSNGNPYLVPDIEVVLSDKVVAVEGTVTRVSNELEVVKSTYAKSADIESTVRRVGSALFLKKTGESDNSESPTTFNSAVSSKNFKQGDVGGTGWGLYEDSSKSIAPQAATRRAATRSAGEEQTVNDSVFEVDKLVVRKELRVNSLVANQISYVGGKRITSAASIECTQVVEDDNYYTCYFDQKQGSIKNLFVVNDVAMGQVFDEENVEVRYYRMLVSEVGADYVKLQKSGRDGQGSPEKGDIIIQYGNTTNAARQYVIVEDVIGGGYMRMISGLGSTSAAGTEYFFAGRQSGQNPRAFIGNSTEYLEWANGILNIKGRVVVRKGDGSYEAMSDYIADMKTLTDSLQAQIDGQIQSWSSGEASTAQTEPLPKIDGQGQVDPSTANFPASSWTLDTDREKHFGDIYVDDTTGQGYRYTKRTNNGATEYYWVRITDEELAQALQDIQTLQQEYAGLEYLKTATNGGTLIEGGLVLSSLIQLGYTSGSTFNVMSGINGVVDTTLADQMKSIAAWYGGPMVDLEAMGSGSGAGTGYAKSLFRLDGSGYLASGKIGWDAAGAGHIPGISWAGNTVLISGDVKLESVGGDTVTSMLSLLRQINDWFGEDESGNIYVKKNNGQPRNFYSYGAVTAGGRGSSGSGSGGGGGTGIDLDRVWQSLTNSIVDSHANDQIASAHLVTALANYLRDNDERLLFVDPDEGVDVVVDDPGTTGTVLWGAESANQVYLDVNGTSKALLKPQAIDGIQSSIGVILGYFTGGSANNALRLEGRGVDYFATASGLSSLSDTVAALVTGVSSVVGQTGDVTVTQIATALTGAGYKLTDTIYTLPEATSGALGGIKIGYSESGKNYAVQLSDGKAYVNVPWTDTVYTLPTAAADVLGGIKIGTGLTVDANGVVSVTGQTVGTVTSVGLSMPTGFSVANSPITSSGNLAVTFASGYSLPTTEKQGQWDEAYTYKHTHSNKTVLDGISENDVTAWSAKYDLPSGGIPKTDLASAVQTSLGLADSALQSHQTITLESGTNNGTLKITTAAGTTDNVAVTGLGTAAYRGVATSIGSSITNLVPGSLLYAVLGDAFDSTNTVKAFVNSSISTATATYRGSYNLVSDLSLSVSTATHSTIATALGTAISTADNNDYCYVQIPTSDSSPTEIAQVDRYKNNGTAWSYEYTLNNSGYTAAQWSAINSGITSALVTKLNGIAEGAQVNVIESVKVNGSALTVTSKSVDITAVPLSIITGADDLKAIEALTGTSGFLKKTAANTWALDTETYVPTSRTVNGKALSTDITLASTDLSDSSHLLYVDPEEGEEITIEDPGTTGTVLWGAESAYNVALDVNGVSKTLLKQGALDNAYSRIGIIESRFTSCAANDAWRLNGYSYTYFATAAGLASLQSTVSGLVTGVSSVAGKTGAVSLAISDVTGLQTALDGKQTAGNYVNTIAGAYGAITLGSGLTMTGNELSVTGQTSGTVTSVGLSMPTGFSVADSPVTSSGTLAVTFATGYSLPTTAKQGQWDTAYTLAHTHSNKSVLDGIASADITAWNAKYDKPSGGIPSSDMASAVQTSLGLADSALQSHQSVTLAGGTNNGTLKITTAAGTTDNIAVTGLGTAAYRGVATAIGSSITNLVTGALLYNVLGDSFDSTNTVKAFINSSISTATATYRGSYNVVSDLSLAYNATHAQIEAALGTAVTTADDNDYCFVEIPVSGESGAPIGLTERYKFNGTAWSYEYALNNSGFTSSQWAAINSGITAALVTAFGNKYDKPSGGIPKTDLASAVQDSLGLADSALQSHQTIYALTIKGSDETTALTYTPNSAAGSLTLTKALVGLGNVENTALSTWAGTNNITTLGTISTGVWNATAIAANKLAIDFNWTLIGNSAVYDTDDFIHVNS